MIEAEARKALVEAGRRLAGAGLVARSWGNLSLRLHGGSMAVTPSGIPYAELREDMIVVVDLETGAWESEWKPTSERRIHREIYLRRPEVGAIVHTHQNAASACAAARASVPAPWGEVPCAAYALPGTAALTRATLRALGDGPAVLLANHGVFAVGADMDDAFATILALEGACADYLEAKADRTLPARADVPWDPRWLKPAILDDGSPVQLSVAPYTLAWTEGSSPKRALLDDLAQLAGPRIPVAPGMPASLPMGGIVLAASIGACIHGADAEAAALVLEKNARASIGGEALGGAIPIPAWEARLMRFVYKRSYAKKAAKASGLTKPSGG
jgi:ribulose-5-phosphate 4-epimerase/fuculose-1-phosphate aldolase